MQMTNVLKEFNYNNAQVNKVIAFQTGQLGVDTYYFEPGQILKYHQHTGSDQVFFFYEGEGKFYLDRDGQIEVQEVGPGAVVLAPAGVLHQVENTGKTRMIASQVTKLPIGSNA